MVQLPKVKHTSPMVNLLNRRRVHWIGKMHMALVDPVDWWSRDINKGVSDSFTKSLNVNIFNNDRNSVDAIYSQSHTKLNNGFGFNKESGSLNWSNAGGHGLNAGVTRFEGFGKHGSIGGHTNLFTSNDGNTRLDAYGSGSKWLNGPLQNQREFNVGITGSHFFRG
ncbi:sarcotoxin II-1-like [Musca autumnalis]|uniref:sarcotoxin II-1-like n=1 Tax=Musca autumnalis TaxID=221902 RepID=UPI003CF79099